DQVELGEMMPLGHELRADDDVETAFRDLVELAAQRLDRIDEIAGEDQNAAARKELGRLLLEPLDARPDRREAFGRVTLGTFDRRRRREAAVMANEPPLEAVIDQPGVAVRTLHAEAAGAAQRER